MKSKLNLKLKANLRESIEQEDKKGGGKDLRFLNYYDMKEQQKMTVLLVPDVNGELWMKYRTHGPNLKNRAIKPIGCAYTQTGDNCPVCQKGFDLLNLQKETGDKAYLAEAKRWFGKDHTVVSCIVIDSPIEVNESEDHNQVKLMFLPFAVEGMIKESIREGQLTEEDLTSTPLVLKMTKNAGGQSEYKHSFFARSQIEDDDLAAFDDMVIEQYDYATIDIRPPNVSSDELSEWLVAAEEVEAKATAKDDAGGGSKTTVKNRLSEKLGKKESSDGADGADEQKVPADETGEASGEANEKPPTSSIRDRLSRFKK